MGHIYLGDSHGGFTMTPRAMHGSAPVLALVLLAAIATSRPWSTHRASAAPPADPSTIVIQVDGRDPSLPASFRRYFPSDVRVHRGDRLTFRHIDSGEPHTVTLGRLVDAG